MKRNDYCLTFLRSSLTISWSNSIREDRTLVGRSQWIAHYHLFRSRSITLAPQDLEQIHGISEKESLLAVLTWSTKLLIPYLPQRETKSPQFSPVPKPQNVLLKERKVSSTVYLRRWFSFGAAPREGCVGFVFSWVCPFDRDDAALVPASPSKSLAELYFGR
ncbi:hypothetical protein BT96DRAFT_944176 [Gymnopus androsaceus JB14]|uniref:Uncharacterized protein n=1 Tax=Gymnopus androsaceus JB14 TaxID=1447944 RepID=A0A6A4H4H0_9AGAR|nr:hypothetical protein BT96DRAFT_944176 [Gymnopus androsaceus JB14]